MKKAELISIVIPCYNEEKNINRTLDGLLDVLQSKDFEYEIIAVNDGSKDKTWDVISHYAQTKKNIKGINFMSNFGQSAAYQAGFDMAKGDYVITVSADLETPLDYVLKVKELLDEGYDVVNTNRMSRWEADKGERQVKSNYANMLIAKISGVDIKDRGSGMKGFRKVILDNLRLYGEMHRFLVDYASVYGAKIIEIDTEFKDRDYGESYYKGHKRTIKVLLDLVTLAFLLYFAKKPFTAMPGRLFGSTGAVISGLGGLGLSYLFLLKLMGESIGNRPLFMISVLMVVMGVQSMMMGMIGELMMRNYFESGNRKTYTVRETV